MASKRLSREQPSRRYEKSSVLVQAVRGIHSLYAGVKKSKRKPSMQSRSFAPSSLHEYESSQEGAGASMARGRTGEDYVNEEEFFDEVIGSSLYSKPLIPKTPSIKAPPSSKIYHQKQPHIKKSSKTRVSPVSPGGGSKDRGSWSVVRRKEEKPSLKRAFGPSTKASRQPLTAQPVDSDDDTDGVEVPEWLGDFFDNSDRHAFGMGLMERIFGRSRNYVPEERKNRPFFTYWVTLLQIIIYIVSVAIYGIAPIGLSQSDIQGEVLMTSLAIQAVSYKEIDNLWIGPTQADLIHLGAKYSPCMRKDENIERVLQVDKELENTTACCVYNDGSGCVQSLQNECTTTLATWMKWSSGDTGINNRLSGSVCGQDPKYCTEPASTGAFQWKDDITEWPICSVTANTTTVTDYHMQCDVVGRPCCIGIQGQCIVATREYCEFRKGYFHDEAYLCSQVSCMNEICAMIDFDDPESPDQFYRLFTSLFLSSGLLSLLITIGFQVILQRDLEKLTGTIEMIVLYIGGGVVGSLASVIFIPYFVETGPSGSQFAVLAALFLEALRWNKDDNAGRTILKILFITLFFFAVGLILAQVDNWAHLFGFVFGLLIALGFRPLKSFRGQAVSKASSIITRIVCFVLAVGLTILLILLFYVAPLYDCESCMYFNCIPFTDDYCDGMSVSISRTGNESYNTPSDNR